MKQICGLLLILWLGHEVQALSTLRWEMDDILENIEYQKIIEISREYFENELTVQVLLRYLYSEKFLSALRKSASVPEIKDIVDWMKSNQVDLKFVIEKYVESIRQITPNRIKPISRMHTFSMDSFGSEIVELIQFDEIDKTVDELLRNGNDLAHLYLILMINRYTIEKVFEDDEIVQVLHDLERLGIDIYSVKEHIYRMFRWT